MDIVKVLIADRHCKLDPTNNHGNTPLRYSYR